MECIFLKKKKLQTEQQGKKKTVLTPGVAVHIHEVISAVPFFTVLLHTNKVFFPSVLFGLSNMYLNPTKIAFFSYQHRKNSVESVICVYVFLSYVFQC